MKTLVLLLSMLVINFVNFRTADKDDVTEKMNSLMNDCKEYDLFSGTILIAKDGNIVFENSYGLQNKENGIPNKNNTKYNIGSIGKEFTAIMILQLMQENKLSLNDNLGKYLTFFSNDAASKVTIKNLLTHSSGFGDYIMNPEFMRNKDNYKELSELLKLISKEQLEFEPGSGKKYSNSGYCILGGIIESITGKSYQENMKERILDPLSMNSSGYIDWDIADPFKAIGYIKNIKGDARNNNNLRLQPSPAGGMYSTVEDMLKLDQSLMNDNKLLDDKHKSILFSGFQENPPHTFAEIKNNPNGENAIAGGAPGINALYISLPAKGYTAIILSNYDQAAENLESQVTDIMKGKDYEKPKLPFGEFLYSIYQKEGQEYFSANLKNLIKEKGVEIKHDGFLNNLGYQFLQNELPLAAIEIFKLNVEMFPDVANCYDSLGEAYMMTGNKEKAKENYAKVLQMDPGNENAKKMLEN